MRRYDDYYEYDNEYDEKYDEHDIEYDYEEQEKIKNKKVPKVSKEEVKNDCNKYKVPNKIFEILSMIEPYYYRKVGIKSLKYHVVLLDRFKMLDTLEQICESNKKIEIEKALKVFKISTKEIYSYLEALNSLKKSNNVDTLTRLAYLSVYKLPKHLKGLDNFVKDLMEFILDDEDRMYMSDFENAFDYFLHQLSADDLYTITELFPFKENTMNLRVKMYNDEWEKKEIKKKIRKME